MILKSCPTAAATATPVAVPIVEDKIACEPALAVMSARFSRIANDLWMAARDALCRKTKRRENGLGFARKDAEK